MRFMGKQPRILDIILVPSQARTDLHHHVMLHLYAFVFLLPAFSCMVLWVVTYVSFLKLAWNHPFYAARPARHMNNSDEIIQI